MKKKFRLETILTVVGDYLLSGMIEAIDLIEYMVQKKISGELDLLYARKICRDSILDQHPELSNVDYSGLENIDDFIRKPKDAKKFIGGWIKDTGVDEVLEIEQFEIEYPEITPENIEKIYEEAVKFYEEDEDRENDV